MAFAILTFGILIFLAFWPFRDSGVRDSVFWYFDFRNFSFHDFGHFGTQAFVILSFGIFVSGFCSFRDFGLSLIITFEILAFRNLMFEILTFKTLTLSGFWPYRDYGFRDLGVWDLSVRDFCFRDFNLFRILELAFRNLGVRDFDLFMIIAFSGSWCSGFWFLRLSFQDFSFQDFGLSRLQRTEFQFLGFGPLLGLLVEIEQKKIDAHKNDIFSLKTLLGSTVGYLFLQHCNSNGKKALESIFINRCRQIWRCCKGLGIPLFFKSVCVFLKFWNQHPCTIIKGLLC